MPALLARSVRHFFPDFNTWLDELPDSRFEPLVVYPTRFMAWRGICLYLFRLGSRRQLDFELSADSHSMNPEKLRAYYLLLQIGHLLIQLVERGSLLWQLAAQWGKTPEQLFGSQKNVGRRLLEGMRYGRLPGEEEGDEVGQIRLVGWNTS